MAGLPSDHPTVETVRATVARHGGGRRLDLPEGVGLSTGIMRVECESGTRFARVESVSGTPAIVGLYATADAARAGDVDRNRLADWLAAVDRPPGRSVLVDVLEPGADIGLRAPGQRLVYRVRDPPDPSLRGLADELLEGSSN